MRIMSAISQNAGTDGYVLQLLGYFILSIKDTLSFLPVYSSVNSFTCLFIRSSNEINVSVRCMPRIF